MGPLIITGLMGSIVLLDALIILRWTIALKRQARPYAVVWCYKYVRRGRRLVGYLRTSLTIWSIQVLFFLPQTFVGSNAMRHTADWYGGTCLLLALASYGLCRWLLQLLTVAVLGVSPIAPQEKYQ